MAVNPSTLETLRHHRAVVYAAIAAAIAVAACALVAIAWMLGWVPSRHASPPVSSRASLDAAETLAPGETLVTAPAAAARHEPLMPTYSQPTPPPPAPIAADPPVERPALATAPARKPATTRPPERRDVQVNPDAPGNDPTAPLRTGQLDRYRYAEADAPAPRAPSYVRRDRYAAIPTGVVSTITSYDPELWDVRVRLDAGGSHIFRFRNIPPFHIGDRVRIDGSRLMHD
jgi:hypothetical protein